MPLWRRGWKIFFQPFAPRWLLPPKRKSLNVLRDCAIRLNLLKRRRDQHKEISLMILMVISSLSTKKDSMPRDQSSSFDGDPSKVPAHGLSIKSAHLKEMTKSVLSSSLSIARAHQPIFLLRFISTPNLRIEQRSKSG